MMTALSRMSAVAPRVAQGGDRALRWPVPSTDNAPWIMDASKLQILIMLILRLFEDYKSLILSLPGTGFAFID
eukprot:6190400-Pleurochrysis_carterae.AAC.2